MLSLTIRNQDAHQLSTSHFGFFSTLHLRPRQGVLSMQNMQWNTHSCTIFLHPQHKPSGVKYAYQTYFIYIQSSNMKSIFCHPGITRYSQNRPHFKYIFSQKEEDLRAKGLMRTSILEWFLLKVFNVKYFQRTSSKWPWMSKLKISWIVTIWTKNVQSHFCCPPRVPDEYRGDLKKKKDFPRGKERHPKKKKKEKKKRDSTLFQGSKALWSPIYLWNTGMF